MNISFTPTSYSSWAQTKNTYHLYFQILGKIKLALMPRRNHWWQIAFHVTPTGLSSGTIMTPQGALEMRIDLVDHQVVFEMKHQMHSISLIDGLTIADYYSEVQTALGSLGLDVHIWTKPFDNISTTSFTDDTEHHTYNKQAIETYFENVTGVHAILEIWQATYKGKISPINNYWHSFDIATTFFSGRQGPDTTGWDMVGADAYSDEVMSFGWWPGDHKYEEAAFYAYMYPDPADSLSMPLSPKSAFWTEKNGAGLALLKHDDVIATDDHVKTVMEFYQSFYKAGCAKMSWDTTNKKYQPR